MAQKRSAGIWASKIVLPLICLATLLISLVFLLKDDDRRSDSTVDGQAAVRSSLNLSDNSGDSRSRRSSHKLKRRIREILALTDPATRSAEFEALILGLKPAEFAYCHEVFWEGDSVDEAVWKDYEKLMARWGGIAPKDGLQFSKDRIGERTGTLLILKSWAESHPSEAIAWVNEAYSSSALDQFPDYWIMGLVEGLVMNDTGLATEFLVELNKSNLAMDHAIDSILSELGKHGEGEAQKWLDSIELDHIKKAATSRLAIDLATTAPQESANLLESVFGENPDDITTVRVFEKWVMMDVSEAMNWLDSHSVALRGNIGISVIDALVNEQGITSASNWLMNFPEEPGFDPAVERVVSVYQASEQPELAAQWVLRLSDDKRREKISSKFFTNWMSQDPQAAKDFMEENGVSRSVLGE